MRLIIDIDWKKILETFLWAVTALSMIPYSSGDIALLFPVAWRPYITGIFGTATVFVKCWRAIPPMPQSITTPPVTPVPPTQTNIVPKKKRKKKGSK